MDLNLLSKFEIVSVYLTLYVRFTCLLLLLKPGIKVIFPPNSGDHFESGRVTINVLGVHVSKNVSLGSTHSSS